MNSDRTPVTLSIGFRSLLAKSMHSILSLLWEEGSLAEGPELVFPSNRFAHRPRDRIFPWQGILSRRTQRFVAEMDLHFGQRHARVHQVGSDGVLQTVGMLFAPG